MIQFTDTTEYSGSIKEPLTFKGLYKGHEVLLYRRNDRARWFVSCRGYAVLHCALQADTPEEAQEQAKNVIRAARKSNPEVMRRTLQQFLRNA